MLKRLKFCLFIFWAATAPIVGCGAGSGLSPLSAAVYLLGPVLVGLTYWIITGRNLADKFLK